MPNYPKEDLGKETIESDPNSANKNGNKMASQGNSDADKGKATIPVGEKKLEGEKISSDKTNDIKNETEIKAAPLDERNTKEKTADDGFVNKDTITDGESSVNKGTLGETLNRAGELLSKGVLKETNDKAEGFVNKDVLRETLKKAVEEKEKNDHISGKIEVIKSSVEENVTAEVELRKDVKIENGNSSADALENKEEVTAEGKRNATDLKGSMDGHIPTKEENKKIVATTDDARESEANVEGTGLFENENGEDKKGSASSAEKIVDSILDKTLEQIDSGFQDGDLEDRPMSRNAEPSRDNLVHGDHGDGRKLSPTAEEAVEQTGNSKLASEISDIPSPNQDEDTKLEDESRDILSENKDDVNKMEFCSPESSDTCSAVDEKSEYLTSEFYLNIIKRAIVACDQLLKETDVLLDPYIAQV